MSFPVPKTAGPPMTPNDRLAHLLSRLLSSTQVPSSAQEIIAEAHAVISGYDTYTASHSSAPPPIISAMITEGNAKNWDALHRDGHTKFQLVPEMCAGGYEGVVLAMFAKMANAKRVLEIGMFTGTSTVALATVPCVEKVVTLDIEPYLENNNKPFFEKAGIAHKIDIRIGDASESLKKLGSDSESFDMIYLDAHKSGYLEHYNLIMDLGLMAPRGFIAADNTVIKAAPWAPDEEKYPERQFIDQFNKVVREDKRVDVAMLSIRDGISLIRRKDE